MREGTIDEGNVLDQVCATLGATITMSPDPVEASHGDLNQFSLHGSPLMREPYAAELHVARTTDYDPFSEEGDHDWMLHHENDALFSQGPDADFFNVDVLAF